jgi:3beta-hydroxy-delta5-steroid dehydrogenase/steroid delta-isomerase
MSAATIGPRVLVTGGAGFLASYLVRALLDIGCKVRVFDVRAAFEGNATVESRVGDIRDYRALRSACDGIDTVFHTAAVISLLGVARPDERRRVYDINVLGTENVIRACKDAGVGRLVYTSSANVGIDREVIEGDESTPYAAAFVDLSTETKVLADQRVLAANDPKGLRTVAIRPGGIWGPGDGGLMIRTFVEQLAAGALMATIGDGKAVVDNTHVENLVDAELLAAKGLADRPEVVGGQGYYVTDDERINGLEWFRPLAEGLGYDFPTLRLPGGPMLRIAHLLEWLHYLGGPVPTLTRIGVLKLIRASSFKIDKARRELGYAPRVQSAEGLEACLPDARDLHHRLRAERSLPGARA